MMIADVMRHCRNYFIDGLLEGVFTIDGEGNLSPFDGFAAGEYVAIVGSAFHDGVFVLGEKGLSIAGQAETFDGKIYTLRPPASFLALCKEIESWQSSHPQTNIASETFEGYSRSLATSGGVPLGWQAVFAAALSPFRRMFSEVVL